MNAGTRQGPAHGCIRRTALMMFVTFFELPVVTQRITKLFYYFEAEPEVYSGKIRPVCYYI